MRQAPRWCLTTLMVLGTVVGCGTMAPAPSPAPITAPAPGTSSTSPPLSTGTSTPSAVPSAVSPSVPSTAPPSVPPTAPPSVPPTAPPSVPPTAPPSVPPSVPPTAGSTPASLPTRLLGVDWSVLPTGRPVVALTFDCGASNAGVAPILRTLADAGLRATFFVTGAFARSYPADVARFAAAGHVVGNHSDTHAHYPELTDAQIAADLVAAQASLVEAGATSSVWFRFPFGDRTDADVRAVNAAGWVPVRWTVDTLGWQGTSAGRTAAEVTARVLDAVRPGEIVLMHVGAHPQDGSTLDADALPGMITRLRDAGYGFATIDLLVDG